jgi:amidase
VPDLCYYTAREITALLRSRQVTAVEVLETHLSRIAKVNPALNAIVTLSIDDALREAKAADDALRRGETLGPLHGLPVAHKDLTRTKGLRTTFGSKIFAQFIPEEDALIVERLKAAGAITVGKTNTPEFGAGSQTFNDVFGSTLNPFDRTKTCGGSSGGAAVALASGMLPIADGTDIGGSLRNPASFCNVVGFRPSPGRVPIWPSQDPWFPLGVQGPMARTVGDVALVMSAVAGPDRRNPLSLPESSAMFDGPLERNFEGTKIAWAPTFANLPFETRISNTVNNQRQIFEELKCNTEESCPDMTDAKAVFDVWRAWYFELCYGSLLESHRKFLKDTVVWNIEEGRKLSGPQLGEMARKRSRLLEHVRHFMEEYEFLVLPVTQVAPFSVSEPYVREIDGTSMQTYTDWMSSCSFISVLGLPAISVPCGFTEDGLPVGLQIVGRQQDDFGVLQLAHAFEEATGIGLERPNLDTLTTSQAT